MSTATPQDLELASRADDPLALNELASSRYWRAQALQHEAIAKAANKRIEVLERRQETLTLSLQQARLEVRAPKADAPSDKTLANANGVRRQRDMMLRALGVKGYIAALEEIRKLQTLRSATAPAGAPVPENSGRPVGPDGLPCFSCARATPMGNGWACQRSSFACKPSKGALHYLPRHPVQQGAP